MYFLGGKYKVVVFCFRLKICNKCQWCYYYCYRHLPLDLVVLAVVGRVAAFLAVASLVAVVVDAFDLDHIDSDPGPSFAAAYPFDRVAPGVIVDPYPCPFDLVPFCPLHFVQNLGGDNKIISHESILILVKCYSLGISMGALSADCESRDFVRIVTALGLNVPNLPMSIRA